MLVLGTALEADNDPDGAVRCWREGAEARGDFSEMSPRSYSENTYYSVLAARRLGETEYADELVTGLAAHTELLARTPAKIDYFATSLPALLLFDEDPQAGRISRSSCSAPSSPCSPVTGRARRHLDTVSAPIRATNSLWTCPPP